MGLSPREAYEAAGKGDGVIGWSIGREARIELLQLFPPKFPDIIADHVTLAAKVARNAPLPAPVAGEIVGRIDDGAGVEALVVRIDGTTDRPDGSTFHITWSLDKAKGRRAKESNDVIARLGWQPIALPQPLTLTPARWP